jgi:hypothetical protein
MTYDLYMSELITMYEDYIATVSTDEMAISFKMATAISDGLHLLSGPVNVVDLGSGFTSAMLGFYQKVVNPKMTIMSVDTDIEWLTKSKEFCSDYNLPMDNAFLWSDFVLLTNLKFDLIVFDIGYTDDRGPFFEEILTRFIHRNTKIYIDDAHKTKLIEKLQEQLKNLTKSFRWEKLENTTDKFGRYGVLLTDVEVVK